jgi:hypothetical protein
MRFTSFNNATRRPGISKKPVLSVQTKPNRPHIMKAITSILSILALAATLNAADGDKKPEADKKKKADPEAAFKKLDSNGDGSISKEEWAASPMAKKDAAKADKMFAAKDKDKDGKLSKEEFTAPGKKKDAK